MHEKLLAAVEEVFRDIMALSKEEFYQRINSHIEGDVAAFLLDTNAFDVEVERCKAFDEGRWEVSGKMFPPVEVASFCRKLTYSSSPVFSIKSDGDVYINNICINGDYDECTNLIAA